jgi:hypothetical protein
VSARPLPRPAKRVVHTFSVAAGRLSSRSRMLPSFLIVGAQRSGTTSMYRALSQHPLILKPVLHKGIHYFDLHYGRGLAWYRAHFPLARAADRIERSSGIRPLTFESSPYYMVHPLAAERYARDLPGVKLLVLVRDPVERAFSAHAHELARGYETEPFERALELERTRVEGEAERMVADPEYLSFGLQHHAYRLRGQYIDQLERLEALVGRDSIHVVQSAEFFSAPATVFAGVLEFLGLPQMGEIAFDRHNARPRSPMPPQLRAELEAHFRPYDERLEAWLGHAPGWRT